MLGNLIGTESLKRSMYSILIGVGLALLAGCNSPSFVNSLPATYLAPLPDAINGTWANETENGERVRLVGQKDGTLKLYFSSTKPSSEPTPKEPLLAQTMRFDNTDWILLDFRKMAAWQGEKSDDPAPFRLLKFVLEKPDRLCGIEMDAKVFAEAINSGLLAGKAVIPPPHTPQQMSVTVTSPGDIWVKWWIALPEAQKTFAHPWCFVRAK